MSINEVDLLQQLVRISSVNPAFTSDGSGGEAKLTGFLQSLLEDLGRRWLRQTVHPGRENLVAIFPGTTDDVMLWEVHQDTVGINGMKIDPFGGEQRDGRIWGRGACDIKGGMAAMLAALARFQDQPEPQLPTIVLGLTVNEECGFSGAAALSSLWSQQPTGELSGSLDLAELLELRPSRAIVSEPTLLDVVVAHRGVVRWNCHAHGRAAHSSQPEQGNNAIYAMADITLAIEQYHLQELSQREPHARCGRPTVCVSTITGGCGVNTVPDHVKVTVDRRLSPGESAQAAYEELVAYIAKRATREGASIEHETPWIESSGLEDHHNQAWAEQVASVVRGLGRSSELVGVPYGTDAPAIAADDLPTVVFGPGSIDQAHTDDEWLAIDQLSQATEVFYRLACGAAN